MQDIYAILDDLVNGFRTCDLPICTSEIGWLQRFEIGPFLAAAGALFFFQAEDGIRDDLVTGVQTCALPICRPWRVAAPRRAVRQACARDGRHGVPDEEGRGHAGRRSGHPRGKRSGGRISQPWHRSRERSEERRVGKEGRSRWSPYH